MSLGFSAGHFQRAKKTALAIIDRLGPSDQAAMMAASGLRDYQVEFTTDRKRLARAIERFALSANTMAEPLVETLTRISQQLEPVSRRRKAIVLISEGFVVTEDMGDQSEAGQGLRTLMGAAQRANVAIYTFDPGFSGDIDRYIETSRPVERRDLARDDNSQVGGLRTIAHLTGGRATVRTNFLAEGVVRMLAESRSHYLLGYYARAPQDGKFHKIAVKVNRPDLDVRARAGYMSPKPGKPDGSVAVAPVVRLAHAPVQTHGLDMRTVLVPVPWQSRAGSAIMVVTEIRGAQLAGASAVT